MCLKEITMTEKEFMDKAQEIANAKSENLPLKRKTELTLLYSEKLEDGSVDHYMLGSDMPYLIFRIFNEKADGTVTENTNLSEIAEKSRHYNSEIVKQLGIDKAPVLASEAREYEIVLENKLENNDIEIKLKSSLGRNITMIELFRYFDYVTKIYFVLCVSPSCGLQYLFSVTPDSQHLRVMIEMDANTKNRIDMINELFRNQLLPSYLTVKDGMRLLTDNNIHADVSLTNAEGKEVNYRCLFCYDDEETQSRFAFFSNIEKADDGIILIQDIFTQKLLMSNDWNDAQRSAVDRIKALMNTDAEKFQKNVTTYFCDNLDFRYKAFKNGTLKVNTETK